MVHLQWEKHHKTSQSDASGGLGGNICSVWAHSLFRLKIHFTVNNLEHGFYLFSFLLSVFSVSCIHPVLNDRHNMKDKGLNEPGCDLTRVCLITGPPRHPLLFFPPPSVGFRKTVWPRPCTHIHTPALCHPFPSARFCPLPCYLPPLHSCLAYSTIQPQPPAIQLTTRLL